MELVLILTRHTPPPTTIMTRAKNSHAQELVTKIDEILKDMEKKNPTPRESWKLKLPSGKVLDPPSAGDWVLVDIANSQLIHNSVLNIQVVAGGTYLVLPMRGSDISEADLKEAVKVVKATRTGEDVPPVYTSGESGRG